MRHKPKDAVRRTGRRTFLAGTAGGLVALPVLESLGFPKQAHGWAPAPGMPQRLIVMHHGHGTIVEELVPTAGYTPGKILQPVADVGLLEKTLVVTGVDGKVSNGHGSEATVLTCTPKFDDQFGGAHSTSASVDHVIAKHMQDGGLARRLDLSIHDESTDPSSTRTSRFRGNVFWTGHDEWVESIVNPSVTFDTVFPGGTGAPPPEEPAVDFAARRRGSVLDAVLGDFNSLMGRVSSGDRDRLDRHAERLREIEQSLQRTGSSPMLPRSASCDSPSFPSRTGLTHAQAADLQVDLLAHAIACNQFDVGTFRIFGLSEQSLSHVNHPELARTFAGENYHGAWHSASDQGLAHSRRAFAAVDAWYGSLFARLLAALDGYDEGNGTALDNTCVLWLSEFGHGGGHQVGSMHVVFAGNVGGAAMGRHVDFHNRDYLEPWRDENNPGNHNLAVTLLQAFGVSGDRFGNYDNVAHPVRPGPLSL